MRKKIAACFPQGVPVSKKKKIPSYELSEEDAIQIAEDYIATYLDGNRKEIPRFMPAILYMVQDSITIDRDDIQELRRLWDVYVRLASYCGVLYNLEGYSMLTGIGPETLSEWAGGEYRVATPAYAQSVRNWKAQSAGGVRHALQTREGSNVNLIFAAKAIYGMVEAAPQQLHEANRNTLAASELVKMLPDKRETS